MLPLPASPSGLTHVAWERPFCYGKFNHRPPERALLQKAGNSLPGRDGLAGGGYDPLQASLSGAAQIDLAGFPLSLADASVDPFPQQVGVAAVAGVLLNHVDKHFAQRDGVPVSHSPPDAEVWGAGDELLREGDLVAPGLPGIVYDRWVGDRAGPVSIR